MAALGITILKNNAPWGPFTRAQIEDGLARGDFTVKYLAHAPGLKEWLPLGEVIDYVERSERSPMPSLPPVPERRELPPLPEPPSRPPVLPAAIQPAPPAVPQVSLVGKPEVRAEARPEVQLKPASFFPRGIAFLLDCAVLFVPVVVIFLLGALAIEIPALWDHASHEAKTEAWDLLKENTRRLAGLVAIGLGWLYGAGLESSTAQATFGKRWMGLKVTDAYGARLSFLRATARYAAKYLSALPCFLGFIMALFSSRGLALHDRLAGTRVVRE
ncbi:MAG: RDD family protein [Methylacidiphilales bacterium]|nr:RDD family protein [Candidatus Methylacidiphilales bacterium]